MGRFAGISVRIHITLFLYAFYSLQDFKNPFYGVFFITGLFASILLHEFGHAFAARFCDGEANEILLWPLGGLALCRPLFNPTAHLITAAAGPLVTLALVLLFGALNVLLPMIGANLAHVSDLVFDMMIVNGWLLIFNMIPAFPMDGGRILRDMLWYWLGVDRATTAAVGVSKILAAIGFLIGLRTGLQSGNYMLAILAVFIFFQSSMEKLSLEWQGLVKPFSLRERLRRGKRQRNFRVSVGVGIKEEPSEGFHRCAVCGKTEREAPDLLFRVAADGHEYCSDHLSSRIRKS